MTTSDETPILAQQGVDDAGTGERDEEDPDTAALWRPRWDGRRGRLEVWYATMTDESTGTGLWVHGETVAPTAAAADDPADGAADGAEDGPAATAHGWIAVFPPDGPVEFARSDSSPAAARDQAPSSTGFESEAMYIRPDGTEGEAGELSWRIEWDASDQEPLYTMPRWAWKRELLPAAHVVAAPSMPARGWVSLAGERTEVQGHAAAARIYGHGNARRWAWLHADLGDGDVIELVTAVSTRPVLGSLPPLTFLRMRIGGQDWPRPRIACWGLRSRLDLPTWTVSGRTGGVEVDIRVTQPEERCVSVDYADPDGSTATCTNSESADLRLELRWQDGRSRVWEVEGTAHAEVGVRP